MGSNSKNNGVNSKEIKKMKEKPRAHSYRPKPTLQTDPDHSWRFRAVRLIRMPKKQDPTVQNARYWVGSKPTQFSTYIKGLWTGSPHFFHSFSLFSSLFSLLTPALLWTLNPNFQNPTQKHVIYGSKVPSSCSSHESMAGIYMHSLNQRRSWIFLHGFQSVLWFFFGSNLCFWWNFLRIPRFTMAYARCKPSNPSRFWKKLGFQSFSNRTLWNRIDLCWFSFTDVHAYKKW